MPQMVDWSGWDEGERQRAVDASGAAARHGDPELLAVVQAAAAYYRTAYAAVSIISHDRQLLISRFGIDVAATPRQEAFCATAIQRPGEALVVADARADARFAAMPAVCGPPWVRFYAGIPLVDRGGYALGALCVADPAPLAAPADLLHLAMLALRAETLLTRR